MTSAQILHRLRTTGRRRLAAVLMIVVCAGCGRSDDHTAELPADLNVLVICVDTLGARHLGCYTPGLDNSPRIDALAADGVRFRNAWTTAPWTQPAIASLLTGRMPSDHGVMRLLDRLPGNVETLAERFEANGRTTGAVVSNPLIGMKYGYGRGFGQFDDELDGHGDAITSAQVTDRALSWLNTHRDSTFFLLAHYFDPHNDYMHHPRFDRTADYEGFLTPGLPINDLRGLRPQMGDADAAYLAGLYREEIAFTDEQVGRLLDGLAELGLRERTLVVLTADHGEEFMERGWIGHTRTLYNELLQVPLIFSLPGVLAPRRIDAPGTLLDIAPTVLDAIGDEQGLGDGRSQLPALLGRPDSSADRDIHGEVNFVPLEASRSPFKDEKRALKTCLIADGFKLIHDLPDDTWECYDLNRDPFEHRNLIRQAPVVDDMRERLRRWEAPRREFWSDSWNLQPAADREVLNKLRSLGYIR